jgi:O-succinylbenzoic acid--CoA ligase
MTRSEPGGGLPDPVRYWARRAPGRVALRTRETEWTYAQLDEVVSEAARGLFRGGIDPGAAVSLEARDPLAVAALLHAIHRVGAVAVPLGPRQTEAEAERMRIGAGVVERIRGMGVALPAETGAEAGGPGAEAPESDPGDLARRPGDPAIVCFTSGTSGAPRGVLLTHGNLYASARASATNLGVQEDDLWLSCLPLHHVGGLSTVTRSAVYGTAVLLHDGFDPDAVHEAVDRGGATLLSVVPPMLERLLRARGGRPYPPTLRAALVGGGPCPPALLEEAAALSLRALPTYGLTEATSQVTTLPLQEWPEGLATSGRPLAGIELEIRDADGRPARPGVEGEIHVRGPVVMSGYVDDRRAGRDSLVEGWLGTGDIGAWDPEGRLIVLDRRTDRIVAGGENVSPAEVEAVLAAHPAVVEACVVGLPSGAWGHEVAAAVVLRPGAALTLDELRSYAAGRLSGIKLPRRLRAVASLPRSASGKLLRRVVRDGFREQMPEEDRA